jgi:hypothetical protein
MTRPALPLAAKFVRYIAVPDFSLRYDCRATALFEQPALSTNGLPVSEYVLYKSSVLSNEWSPLTPMGMGLSPGETVYAEIPRMGASNARVTHEGVMELPMHFVHCVPAGLEPDSMVEDAFAAQNAHHGRDIYVQFRGLTGCGLGGVKYRCTLPNAPGISTRLIVQSPKVYVREDVDTYLVLLHFSPFGQVPAGVAYVGLFDNAGKLIGKQEVNMDGNRCYAVSARSLMGGSKSLGFIGSFVCAILGNAVPLSFTFSEDCNLIAVDHSVPPSKYVGSLSKAAVREETVHQLLDRLGFS